MSDLRLRPRRAVLLSLLAICAGVSAPAMSADAYPDKPIRLIVPYPPGGATDVIGRVLAQELTGALGQSVIVENRAGAAGNIGADQVAKAQPDGYTLLMGALTSHSINAALYRGRVTYDVEKSFAPVSIVGTVPLVFVVNPSVQAKTLSEFIALAKSKPGYITMASAGNGSPQHLAGEMFKRTAGVDILHVPYKGSGPAMTDLMGGQVLSMIETVPAAQGNIKAGKLRALAVTSPQRVDALPPIPRRR
jgi:tripartite-type tricarboxylate transporter receptor subunit TctC